MVQSEELGRVCWSDLQILQIPTHFIEAHIGIAIQYEVL